jgi:hypothetical protein
MVTALSIESNYKAGRQNRVVNYVVVAGDKVGNSALSLAPDRRYKNVTCCHI